MAPLPLAAQGPLETPYTGVELLNTPYLNKGTAFTHEERHELALTALLPSAVHSLEQQLDRAWGQYKSRGDDLSRNTFLTSLKEQNEVLYYRLVLDHLSDVFSVVYTPTEGEAIENYSHIFRRPEGIFLNIHEPEKVDEALAKGGNPEDIDYIVVTDGEEILGIGDQGVGGVLISIAKLVLMTICAGVHPNRVLPVVLDCGTNNQKHLNDPLYLGLREKRIRGEAYDKLIDTYVKSARKRFPKATLHFEDFGLTNARRILDKYRPEAPVFNDDVQGTGCVTLAAIFAALQVSKQELKDLRMVVFGAGSAGVGIADQVRDAIAAERKISKEEAAKQIYLIDKPGLLTTSTDNLSPAQKGFAKDAKDFHSSNKLGLLEVIKKIHPNVLIGTSTVPGSFTEEIVREMAAHVERPIILPLSNPTRLHEAVPKDLYHWTQGKALVATGSPFDPVKGPWGPEGKEITITPAECNNSVVFPGIGLGSILSRAKLISDEMLVAAVQGVASLAPAKSDPTKPLLPGVENVREVSVRVARGVIQAAVEGKLATQEGIPKEEKELDEWIRGQMWQAEYRPLKYVKK
jgi:malate dehydrogenase (oxaloacetate-decarboxylating)